MLLPSFLPSFLPYLLVLCSSGLFLAASGAYSADPQYVFEFDRTTIGEDGWSDGSLGGFSGNPAGTISSGVQLLSLFSPKSKDNIGLTLTVKAAADLKALDEVCFVYSTTEIDTLGKPVLITANIQADSASSNASIFIGTLKGNLSKGIVDGSISYVNPQTSKDYITPQRISCVYKPDSGERYITPFIQVAAKKFGGTATIYVDRIEVYLLDETATNFPLSLFGSTLEDAAKTPAPAQITIQLPDLSIIATPLKMVYIPAGLFTMGSPDTEKDRRTSEGPQHRVTITPPFYMGMYEVTQAQWQSVMGSNPSQFKGGNLPVESISWNDCQKFIKKLNSLGQGVFRLPTEAEWEYACRAGTVTRFYWGDDNDYSQIGQYAWYSGNSDNQTHEVGKKLPNAWGLFDMSGNVWEWCQDWYSGYTSDRQTNPQGPSTGSYRVFRGSCWYNYTVSCRSANRDNDVPNSWVSIGFRVVRTQ